jgi:hypothetical protein
VQQWQQNSGLNSSPLQSSIGASDSGLQVVRCQWKPHQKSNQDYDDNDLTDNPSLSEEEIQLHEFAFTLHIVLMFFCLLSRLQSL